MLSLTLVAIFVATIGFILWLGREKKPDGFKDIPGPIGLPIFGNIFQIGQHMHLTFSRWAIKYGGIYQIHLGNRKAIIISETKMLKEILSGDMAFTGRQIFEGFEMYENEPLGIASTEGELWEVHRRFLLRQLRDFGFGKSSMEEMVMDEVKETIDHMRQSKGKPLDKLKDVVRIAVLNSLWMIVGSRRFKHDDPKILEMMKEGDELLNEVTRKSVILFLPWTRFFLPKIPQLEEVREKGKKFYSDAVNYHKETLDVNSPRDFIDVYLMEMNVQKDNPASMFYGDRAERQLHVVLADLFFAGADTTSTTITWAVLYLAKNKNVQEKMQQEIDKVVGNTRHVTLDDKAKMPYTLAVMEEVFRYSSILATGVQHRAITGKSFREYFIPENAWIFANLYHIHHDKNIWGDPQNFRPERFLSTDEQVFKRSEYVLPFQVGRRQCIGESLARDSFFLFLANMFQAFEVSPNPSKPEPSIEPQSGFIMAPQPYSVVLKERQNSD